MSLRHFFDELKRRHVMRVTGVYLVAAYAVVQGAATVFPLLGFPDGAARAVLIIAIMGLPVAVLLAWVFDITPEGVRRTAPADPNAPAPSLDQQIEAHRRRLAARAVGFVGVGILVALVGFAAFNSYADTPGSKASGPARIESLAVLPFKDLSANRDQEYFTDGVTEELLNRLAGIDSLRVPGRTSSFAFKGRDDVDIAEIGNRLKVDAVLEGSVRRDGDNVRVTARLIDVKTGSTLWSNTYDRKASSVFAIQDEISSEIVEALKLYRETVGLSLAASERGTENEAARDLYYKGLKAFNERTEEQLRTALQYFEQATGADTAYALAYAGLAKTYAVLPAFTSYSVVDALRKGSEAAARAIALDGGMGEAHAALGQIAQNLEWDLTSALRSYKRAVRFSPNDATAHQWYAEALMMTGDFVTAALEIERALEIEPLAPAAKNLRAYLAVVRGDLPGALRHYQNLVREAPGFRLAQTNYAFAALAAKDYGSATEALITALPQLGPDVGLLIGAASGQTDRAAALAAIRQMEATLPGSIVSLLYVAVGANDVAMKKIKEVFDSGDDANFPYVLVHPLLKPLRARPEFQQIARTVGVTLT